MSLPQQLPQIVTAIGGLGTAAFGLLDAAKSAFPFINRIGFRHIRDVVSSLAPTVSGASLPPNVLPPAGILKTLEANWVNGVDLIHQKQSADALLKLYLDPDTAAAVAKAANFDPVLLTTITGKTAAGVALSSQESDAYTRFEAIISATLDEAYQLADQDYRNGTRVLAAMIAIAIAMLGGWSLNGQVWNQYWGKPDMFQAFFIGLLATPLAPIAKDLSSALSTAVDTMQAVKQ
jgi:hypothetical protein